MARRPPRSTLFPYTRSSDLSAVCFRFRGESKDDENHLNRLNQAILKRVIERGQVYISNASIWGKFALRACFVNHRTADGEDRKSTRLNSSHPSISYAVFCLK